MVSAARFGRYDPKPTVSSASLSRSLEPLISLPQPSPGPLQKEKQQAIATVATATELADFYESLDLRKQIPSGGGVAWDGG